MFHLLISEFRYNKTMTLIAYLANVLIFIIFSIFNQRDNADLFFNPSYWNFTTADVTVHANAANYVNARVETTGSPDITYEEATVLDSSGGAITATLGSGWYVGQTKTISMQEATTSSTVSITNHRAGDPYVGTFNALDETWVLIWTGTEWEDLGTPTCTFV